MPVNHTKWLILNVNVSSANSGGNSSVTADLTHNNQYEDTSNHAVVPDGIPIRFITNNGAIIGTAYTLGGKASTILNLNTTQPQNVMVSALLDNQTVTTTGYIVTGEAVLNIQSTAIDNSTGQTLNITYNIPLTESVTWLSILWTPSTINGITNPAEKLQVVINGAVILEKFIYNNNGLNRDNLTYNLVYPGVSGFNITFTDPDDSSVITLNFPGSNVSRTSTIVYNGTPYEGVHSFAIATTKVTKDLFNYWLNQSSLYQSPGGLSDAYATFMTSLMVEYAHDVMAESVSSDLNVTWSRTRPVVVSTHQDANEVYLTLDTDHSMGMTAVGTPDDLWIFNYLTSSSISSIEYLIMNGVTNSSYQYFGVDDAFGSVIVDMMEIYRVNNESLKSFLQDNYLIIKSVNNYNYIVINLKTGIVMDINTINNFCGVTMSTIVYDVNPISCFNAYGEPSIGYPITFWGNPRDLGAATFYWDGRGKIFLASGQNVNPFTDQIAAMGELTVTNLFVIKVSFNEQNPENTWVWGPALDITNILLPFVNNTISLSLEASGTRYGVSSLWLIQAIPEIPHLPINTTNIDDFIDPGEEYTQEEKNHITEGIIDVIWGLYLDFQASFVDDSVVGIDSNGKYIRKSDKAADSLSNGIKKIIDALYVRRS